MCLFLEVGFDYQLFILAFLSGFGEVLVFCDVVVPIVVLCLDTVIFSCADHCVCTVLTAAVNKLIKEMLPNMRISNDARELVLNCCTGRDKYAVTKLSFFGALSHDL